MKLEQKILTKQKGINMKVEQLRYKAKYNG